MNGRDILLNIYYIAILWLVIKKNKIYILFIADKHIRWMTNPYDMVHIKCMTDMLTRSFIKKNNFIIYSNSLFFWDLLYHHGCMLKFEYNNPVTAFWWCTCHMFLMVHNVCGFDFYYLAVSVNKVGKCIFINSRVRN